MGEKYYFVTVQEKISPQGLADAWAGKERTETALQTHVQLCPYTQNLYVWILHVCF